ncbi:uncharacterized protein LOC120430309 [Culex pipiens pallens]|uniref:uncharacterized protein LOC120430309 n=1 Tax=Culex pipiens pallens TaxID=42434 RepID=UPI001952C3C8|nr:uncharacterized protein LOC120430309 [Culex pipiens pallens]
MAGETRFTDTCRDEQKHYITIKSTDNSMILDPVFIANQHDKDYRILQADQRVLLVTVSGTVTFEKTEDILYVSALEDITSSGSLQLSDDFGSRSAALKDSAQDATVSPSTASPQKRTPDASKTTICSTRTTCSRYRTTHTRSSSNHICHGWRSRRTRCSCWARRCICCTISTSSVTARTCGAKCPDGGDGVQDDRLRPGHSAVVSFPAAIRPRQPHRHVVLELDRYILEFSLMEYAIVQLNNSKLVCAALFLAMRMNTMPGWNKTLEFYSGYKIEDFATIAMLLNNIMTRKPKESLNTVHQEYSHELFPSRPKPFITDLRVLFDDPVRADRDPAAAGAGLFVLDDDRKQQQQHQARQRTILVKRIEHVKPSRCRKDFLRRVEENDKARHELCTYNRVALICCAQLRTLRDEQDVVSLSRSSPWYRFPADIFEAGKPQKNLTKPKKFDQ